MGFFKDTFWPSREVRLKKDIESLTRKVENELKNLETAKYNLELLMRSSTVPQSQVANRKKYITQCKKGLEYDKKQLASLKEQLKKIK